MWVIGKTDGGSCTSVPQPYHDLLFLSNMRLISRNADGTVCRKHTEIIYVERSTCTCTALYILSVPYRFFYPYVIRVQKINDFGFICKFE